MKNSDKRKYNRFAVTGHAAFETPSDYFTGEVANIGAGGLLLRTDAPLLVDQKIEIRFTIDGFSDLLAADGQIVRAEPGLLGVKFEREVAGLLKLLLWLGSARVVSPV